MKLRKKILTAFAAVGTITATVILTSTTSKNYYFNSEIGNDGATGTLEHPFKSLAKLNAIQSALQPGDSVLFDGNFYGSLNINKSGSSSKPIVYSSYEGKATITGLTAIQNWNSLGGGIYESNALLNVPADLNMVTVSGEIVQRGRYPNSGWLLADSYASTTTLTDAALSSQNWTGAQLARRRERWVIDRCNITSHVGSTIKYTGGETAQRQPGYFITNHIKTLDSLNEWYYNPNTKKLSMYSPNGVPQNVKYASLARGVNADQQSNFTISNLNIEGYNEHSINIEYGTKNSVVNCSINNSGNTGLRTYNTTYFNVENNNISNSLNNGIDLTFGTNYATIKNNEIRNTYMIAGMGQNGLSKGLAINVRGKGTLVEYNRILNSGFIPVYFSAVDSLTFRYNFIDRYGLTKDDCGAFYTWTGGQRNSSGAYIRFVNKGRKIHNNIIRNGIGAVEGTTGTGAFANSCYGLYCDANASDIDFLNNYAENTGRAPIFLHFANHINITGNTLFDNQFGFFIVRDATRDNYSNTIKNNIVFGLGSQTLVKMDNYADSKLSSLGVMDNNSYINFSSKTAPFSIKNTNYSFEKWRAATVWDDHSTQQLITSTDVIKPLYTTTQPLTADLDNYVWSEPGNKVYLNPLQPFSAAILIRGDKLPEPTPEPEPEPEPEATITITTDSTVYNLPATITVYANDPTAKSVQFLANDNHIYRDPSAPWATRFQIKTKAGTYKITAKATDAAGKVTTSNSISITVK